MRAIPRRGPRAAAFVVAPFVAAITALATNVGTAAAATGSHSDSFTFTSAETGQGVTCGIAGSLRSVQRTDGRWDLTADVRITSASSNECFDGIAHLSAEHADGNTDDFTGGGSLVQVSSITPTEVTRTSYDIYFNGCGCYSATYHAPK
jgi:hypothetical protein